jgi:hypothetical protein
VTLSYIRYSKIKTWISDGSIVNVGGGEGAVIMSVYFVDGIGYRRTKGRSCY